MLELVKMYILYLEKENTGLIFISNKEYFDSFAVFGIESFLPITAF